MDLKKLRNMQKVSSQFSSITMHSTKTKDGTYTIFYKDTILVSHIPEEALRDYIVAELDALMKKFAGKIEGYLTEIENSARKVNLDFSGKRDGCNSDGEYGLPEKRSPYDKQRKELRVGAFPKDEPAIYVSPEAIKQCLKDVSKPSFFGDPVGWVKWQKNKNKKNKEKY